MPKVIAIFGSCKEAPHFAGSNFVSLEDDVYISNVMFQTFQQVSVTMVQCLRQRYIPQWRHKPQFSMGMPHYSWWANSCKIHNYSKNMQNL